MTRTPESREPRKEILDENAAAEIPEFDEILDTYEDIEESPDEVLQHGQLPSLLDISSLGLGTANRTLTEHTKAAALENRLTSWQFEAVRVQYSASTQTMLCRPEAKYVEGRPNIAAVSWSPDGMEMRVNLQSQLISKGWRIAPGYCMRVPVTVIHRHPKAGSVFILRLKDGELMESKYRMRRKKKESGQKPANGEDQNQTAS
ncbi:MAG: hypothetical protein ACOY93_04110 [Bacillota bacterium]